MADLLFVLAATIMATAGAIRLTQSDGDLAAHIRVGDEMLAAGTPHLNTTFAFTASPAPVVEHSWLADVFFALLMRSGGLALCAVVTGIVIAATHAGVFAFLRNRGVGERTALAAALGSLALGALHWLARPHMFTIAFAFLLLILLEQGRIRTVAWVAALFAVWANVHGGWVYGLGLAGLYVTGDALEWYVARPQTPAREEWRARFISHAAAVAAGAGAALLTPYGAGLYRDVFGTLGRSSVSGGIVEYLSPDFHQPADAVFLVAVLVTVASLAYSRRRPAAPWLLVILANTAIALYSARNVALFAVTAWPLLVIHATRTGALPRWPRNGAEDNAFTPAARHSRVSLGLWSGAAAAFLLVLGFDHGRIGGAALIPDTFDAHVMPVGAVEKARASRLAGHLYTPWAWGGYVMYAWREQLPFLDPLRFSGEVMRSHGDIETLDPRWRSEMDRWAVSIVLVPPASRLGRELLHTPEWSVWYRDETAILFRRSCAGACSTVAGHTQ